MRRICFSIELTRSLDWDSSLQKSRLSASVLPLHTSTCFMQCVWIRIASPQHGKLHAKVIECHHIPLPLPSFPWATCLSFRWREIFFLLYFIVFFPLVFSYLEMATVSTSSLGVWSISISFVLGAEGSTAITLRAFSCHSNFLSFLLAEMEFDLPFHDRGRVNF